eukprot:g17717.t1
MKCISRKAFEIEVTTGTSEAPAGQSAWGERIPCTFHIRNLGKNGMGVGHPSSCAILQSNDALPLKDGDHISLCYCEDPSWELIELLSPYNSSCMSFRSGPVFWTTWADFAAVQCGCQACAWRAQSADADDHRGGLRSAMMPISDLFPAAGIKFWDCAHECNAGMMADGYTRTTGKMSMMIAQNGPGITNFVTPVKTAYWNHTPLLLVTPQAANKTIGQGGFQEVEQMAMFKDSVCYQEEVRDATRICEVLNRVIEKALHCSAPAQINIPRDFWTQVVEFPLHHRHGRSVSYPASVCSDHPLHVGPLGYNGSKAAMEMISKADVVLALGTRLNPFSTLPCYGIEYWPKDAKLIQVDINGDRIGLTKPVDVGIQGDAGRSTAEELLEQLSAEAGSIGRAEREKLVKEKKTAWAQELESMDHELDDEGTTWNQRARAATPERMSPRQAWRAIMRVMPKDAIMSSDIGNNCAIGNAYPSFQSPRKYLSPGLFGPCGYGFPSILGAKVGNPSVPVVGFAGDGAFGISINEITACGRGDWPPVTMIVFRNFQWGAEKRNTTLWYDDNFVGTELNKGVEYAEMAKACGLKGVKVATVEELEQALKTAIDGQMQRKETTLVEVLLNQELGEPFRRDAMKAPVQIAKINASDMSE